LIENKAMEDVESPIQPPAARNAIAALRRFSRPRKTDLERCELCSAPLAPDHQHLIDPAKRQIVCSCDACAILFSDRQDSHFRRVPRRIERWSDFQLSDMQWQGLGVPIALAFFFRNSQRGQIVAMYPSPAGATETEIVEEAWQGLLDNNPRLATLAADVEALLVNRMSGARHYFRTPIDECFKLVGMIRSGWRGMSGGTDLWKQMASFFDDLQRRAIEIPAETANSGSLKSEARIGP
jgi:hypothetical protein